MSVPCVAEHDPAEAGRLFSFEALERAYRECRRRKRGTANALRFEFDLERNLSDLSCELQRGSYQPRRSVCFLATRPKLREIIASDFRDRVVHHFLVRRLEPIFERIFIDASFASRKGKGTHAAVERLSECLPKVTANHTRRAWYAHLDIRSFFPSIDREILYDLVAKKIRGSSSLRWLAALLIFHDPTRGAIWKGDPKLREKVPPGKSLFTVPPGKGLPIGNHTSQFFANVYLNELDHFVKRVLRARFYIRYVDDLVLLSERREELLEWKARIQRFLEERLLLELNERRSRIAAVSSGIDFLGYIVHPRHRLVRRRVVEGLVTRLRALEPELTEDRGGYSWTLYRARTSEYLRAVAASYGAHFRHASARRLEEALGRRFPWVAEALQWPDGRPFWAERRLFPSFGAQAHALDRRFPEGILAIQVGRFFEIHGPRAAWVARIGGLRLIRSRRAGRRGWARVPLSRLGYLLDAARRAGVARIVLVREEAAAGWTGTATGTGTRPARGTARGTGTGTGTATGTATGFRRPGAGRRGAAARWGSPGAGSRGGRAGDESALGRVFPRLAAQVGRIGDRPQRLERPPKRSDGPQRPERQQRPERPRRPDEPQRPARQQARGRPQPPGRLRPPGQEQALGRNQPPGRPQSPCPPELPQAAGRPAPPA